MIKYYNWYYFIQCLPRSRCQTKIKCDQTKVIRTRCVSRSKILSRADNWFELPKVWIMIWFWSNQRSFRSSMVSSEVISVWFLLNRGGFRRISVQSKKNWAHIDLLRNHFNHLLLIFLEFFYWGMLAMLLGNNKAAFGSDTLLESDGAVQKQGFQLIANAVSLYKWICITAEPIFFNKKLSKFIYGFRKIHQRHNKQITSSTICFLSAVLLNILLQTPVLRKEYSKAILSYL